MEEVKQSGQKGWIYPIFDIKWVAAHEVLKRAKSKKQKKRAQDVEKLVNTVQQLSSSCDEYINACDYDLEGANYPKKCNFNMIDNLVLAFRHLEDARMRLGKVMQAYQGGISILDNYKKDDEGKVK